MIRSWGWSLWERLGLQRARLLFLPHKDTARASTGIYGPGRRSSPTPWSWDSQPSELLETKTLQLRRFVRAAHVGQDTPGSHNWPCVRGNPNPFLLPKERGWPSVTLEALSGFSTCGLEFILQVPGRRLLPLSILTWFPAGTFMSTQATLCNNLYHINDHTLSVTLWLSVSQAHRLSLSLSHTQITCTFSWA